MTRTLLKRMSLCIYSPCMYSYSVVRG